MWINGKLKEKLACILNMTSADEGKILKCNSDGNFSLVFDAGESVATPVANPVSGEIASGTTVKLTCSTRSSKIYYTLDGTTPTSGSTEYTTPIAITAPTTIKAIGIKTGLNDSAVLTSAYTIGA